MKDKASSALAMSISSTIEIACKDQLFTEAAGIVSRLQEGGVSAYFVGGCVRDLLLGLAAKDYDIATDAHPEDVERIFPEATGMGRRFGVCLVPVEGASGASPSRVEVAAFRADGPYFDHRRPAWVRYASIEEDARRRDFTVNAIYYDPAADQVIDPVEGIPDLEAKSLRVIGDPFERLDEDWLRLLRAVRFAARFGLEMEFRTWDALRALAPLVTGVSAERRTDEVRAMLLGPHPSRAVGLLYTSGLWKAMWPDLPFSVQRLARISQALEQSQTPETIWKNFFIDLPTSTVEKAVEGLRLTRAEKRPLS